MAQKAAKHTAKRNTAILNRAYLIALAFHGVYFLLRVVLFRTSFTKSSLLLYALFSAPSFVIQAFFELNSRPQYGPSGNDIRRSGQDLEAPGLTEWMWDVLYWTWGCLAVTALLGDTAWWLWIVVPLYSIWSVYSTFGSLRKGFMGGGQSSTAPGDGPDSAKGASKRQQKLERRGGQRVEYR